MDWGAGEGDVLLFDMAFGLYNAMTLNRISPPAFLVRRQIYNNTLLNSNIVIFFSYGSSFEVPVASSILTEQTNRAVELPGTEPCEHLAPWDLQP